MNRWILMASLVSVLLLGIEMPAFAQPANGESAGASPWGTQGSYLWLRYNAGDDIGEYGDSYTHAGGFLGYELDPNSILFAEPRLLVTNNGTFGLNQGFGYRQVRANHVLGIGMWYDVDDNESSTFHQLSGSFEILSEYLDIRSNFYAPIGQQSEVIFQSMTGTGPTFLDRNIFLGTNTTVTDYAMRGLDIEAGGPVPFLRDYGVRMYGGYYRYADAEETTNGGRARLEWQPNEWAGINLIASNDNLFGTSVLARVELFFPGRNAPRINTASLQQRRFQQTIRQSRVTVRRQTDITDELALDRFTGQAIDVVHVDDDAPDGGDGSVDAPFNNLADAQDGARPSSILFVRSGNYDDPIQLQNEQRLLGDGLLSINPHMVAARQGTFLLPDQTSDPLPILTVANSPFAVGLAQETSFVDNVEVAGLVINNPDGAGILGALNNGFYIHDNEVNGAGDYGIILVNGSGTQFVNGSAPVIDNMIANNLVDGAGLGGIAVGNFDLSMVSAPGFDFSGLPIDPDPRGTLEVSINNNEVTNNGAAGTLTDLGQAVADQAGFDARFGVAVAENTGTPISPTITNNTISGNGLENAVSTDAATGGLVLATAGSGQISQAMVEDNEITENLGSNVVAASTDTSSLDATFQRNTVTRPMSGEFQGSVFGASGVFANGFTIAAQGSAMLDLEILDHSGMNGEISGLSSGDLAAGIVGVLSDQSSLTLLVENNTIQSFDDEGITLAAFGDNTASADVQIRSNTITNTTNGIELNGIIGLDEINGSVSLTVDDNDIFSNAGQGLFLSATSDASGEMFSLNLTNNRIHSNTFNGFTLRIDSGTATALIEDNLFGTTAPSGGTNGSLPFDFDVDIETFAGQFNLTSFQNNQADEDGGTGSYEFLESGGTFNCGTIMNNTPSDPVCP